MSIQTVANRLVELTRIGQYETAQNELFADDAQSIEPPHAQGMQTVQGKDSIISKGKQFQSIVEAFHGASVSDAVIAGHYFSVAASLDVTLKGQGRIKMEEVIVYHVVDDKIVSEQFFY